MQELQETNDFQAIDALSQVGSSTGSNNPAAPALIYHTDLARVVELWPVLPPAIRNAILVLANTSAPASPQPAAEDDRDRLPPGYEKRPDR